MPNYIFYGTAEGLIVLYNLTNFTRAAVWQLPRFIATDKNTAAVQEIVPNPGEPTFLAIRKDGQFFLFGQDSPEVAMTFEAPPGGISRIVWLDSVSGDFVLGSKSAGVLRLYNVAQPNYKEIIKVSRHGIYDIKRMTSEIYLLRLKNG